MMPVQPSELREFFTYVISVLEHVGIPYMVVGGFAAIFYGEPRMTIDVDIVVDMKRQHIKPFVTAFPIPEYYVSEEAILDSLIRKYPFNVIQPSTGAKVDVVPLPDDAFSKLAFQHRQPLFFDDAGNMAFFITAEDIIIAKLLAFKATGSDKHFKDARGVLLLQWSMINLDAVQRLAKSSGVEQEFEDLAAVVQSELE